jgi:hypothetical protein
MEIGRKRWEEQGSSHVLVSLSDVSTGGFKLNHDTLFPRKICQTYVAVQGALRALIKR